MKKLALITLATAAQLQLASATPTLLLSGSDWQIREDAPGTAERLADDAGWIPATVPGNIQADLETAHLLKPWSYGAGDPALKAVAEKDWWYRKEFRVPEQFADKRLVLVFDGVDHESEIWLNGQRIGANAGMYRRFQFDVSAVAKPGQSNLLAVRIARHPEIWQQTKIFKEIKSPTNGGWDWGVPIATLGIWKDVRLEATGPARIDWSRVQTSLSPDYSNAVVTLSLDIDSTRELVGTVRFQLNGHGQQAKTTVHAALKKGSNTVRAEIPVQAPKLWWPSGHGEQPLYSVTAELTAGDAPSDSRTTRFGIRDIQWVHTEGAPANHVSKYQLVFNGRPIRMLGSNLIPTDLLFGRMTPKALFRLRQAKATGMNTLRLWGGGVTLHESVYDLADELGIMLVQEFPLANHVPPKDPEYLAMLESTLRNIVRQVRNHPAIVEFDGGNEMHWSSLTDHPALKLIKQVVAEEDGRLCRSSCPDLGAHHGPWMFNLWTTCQHWDTMTTMRAGEFGSASPAHLEVWQREIPPKQQWPVADNPITFRKKAFGALAYHNWLPLFQLEEIFGPFDSLPEILEVGQFYGAEGLRYAVDALRRKGKTMGGLMTWDFNEPWSNGAGSYMVDFDGRPLMNYDFFKQAIAPVSLSLKYDSIFYPMATGLKTELFLTSDAAGPSENLRWKWVARDRRGTVFARNEGRAGIAPLEVKSLGTLTVKPPAQTLFGPFFMELRLEDSAGRLLTERLHVFGMANLPSPLTQLLRSRSEDVDDDASQITMSAERQGHPDNLLRPDPRPKGFNDGYYGYMQGWSGDSFEYRLRQKASVARFKFGRDRIGKMSDRCVDYMKIETSLDGKQWQTVFEKDQLTRLPGFSPAKTVEIQIPPVEAEHVKVTVTKPDSGNAPKPYLDEFEVYPASGPALEQPVARVLDRQEISRPVRRTTLQVEALPTRVHGQEEVLELKLSNTGAMTAFFCEAHPLISYRTDLFIENNHCFIPPGESRTISIRSSRLSSSGLTLAQTGWRISSWNAEEVTVAPSAEVLLAVGRRDKMCREFAGYFEPKQIAEAKTATLSGTRPDPSQLPHRLEAGKSARFEFAAKPQPARLRLHTADQSKEVRAEVVVKLNGKVFEQLLPAGLGIQASDPAHLAFPATVEFELPAGVLKEGGNLLEIEVRNGWFNWDSLECVTNSIGEGRS